MKKYYYFRKNDKHHEVLGTNYNFNRKLAALFFCTIKRISLKDFIKLYDVYPDLNIDNKLKEGSIIKISDIDNFENITSYRFQNNKFKLTYTNKNRSLNLKDINKYMIFYHFVQFLKKENYKIEII